MRIPGLLIYTVTTIISFAKLCRPLAIFSACLGRGLLMPEA